MAIEPLNLPPREAVEHFRAKGLHAGFSWLDTDSASHLRSFTVAKAMQLDVLRDIRAAVDRAIADGTTFEQFQSELEPLLRRRGWWGRQRMIDPATGESQMVQLGSPRRLRIIFDTNIRMAYARGQWQRIERVAEARPWLRYVAVQDDRTRPQHKAWHGTVLRWDHDFWSAHFPPNGWRCRCSVQQLSDEDLEEFGFTPSPAPPAGWKETRKWVNRRTGQVSQVPRGIAPGFQINVGRIAPAHDDADRLIARIDEAEPALRRAAIGTPWQTDLFARHARGDLEGDWPVAVTEGAVAKYLDAESSVVRLSQSTALKQVVRRRGQDFGPDHYAFVQHAIDVGTWFKTADENHIEGYVEIDGRLWKFVLKRTQNRRSIYLVSIFGVEARKLRSAQRRLKRIR